MDSIERGIHVLVHAIERTDEYREYKRREHQLAQNPQLMARVNAYQAANYHLQNDNNREDIFSAIEKLTEESEELKKIPEVNAYLQSELALCKLMQNISLEINGRIEMRIPNL